MADKERIKEHMEADFLPVGQTEVQYAVANALEYIAYHIGQIDKKLDSISMSLAQTAQKD